ncbi:hypothetical protein B0H10DRAFT_1745953, partial [Mycena sp. CBHHK59/15]
IHWAPGHRDIPGNEHADEEAKLAAQHGSHPTVRYPKHSGGSPVEQISMQAGVHVAPEGHVAEECTQSPRYQCLRQFDPKVPSDAYMKLT